MSQVDGKVATPPAPGSKGRNLHYFALLRQVRTYTSRAHREAKAASKRGEQFDTALRDLYETWADGAGPAEKVLVLASAIEAGVMLREHFVEMESTIVMDEALRVLYLAVRRRAGRLLHGARYSLRLGMEVLEDPCREVLSALR